MWTAVNLETASHEVYGSPGCLRGLLDRPTGQEREDARDLRYPRIHHVWGGEQRQRPSMAKTFLRAHAGDVVEEQENRRVHVKNVAVEEDDPGLRPLDEVQNGRNGQLGTSSAPHSTATDFARFQGWSTSVLLNTATR